MEKKKFNEYSAEDKEALLMHWWYYYGKLLVNLEEFETFHDYVLKDSNTIKDAAVIAYIAGESSQAMIGAMRAGKMDEFLAGIKKLKADEKSQYIYEMAEEAFLEEIVATYNNPEKNVPMSDDDIFEQLFSMTGVAIDTEEGEILTAKRVKDIYKACSFKDDEISVDGEPLAPFVVGEGVYTANAFNAKRLEENRKVIAELIAELPKIDEGVSFLTICEDNSGRQWTGLHDEIDLLLQLGTATGELQFLLPRETWSALPGRMPYVIRSKEASNKNLNEYKPAEYKKIKTDYKNKFKGNDTTTQ